MVIVSLKEINQCSYQKENDKCNEHKGEMYSSYCKGCKCLLCVECIKSHETTHEIISIEDYVNDVRNSLVNIKFKNTKSPKNPRSFRPVFGSPQNLVRPGRKKD